MIIEKEFATYEMEQHEGFIEVNVKYKVSHSEYDFKVFDTAEEMEAWIERNEKIRKIMSIMDAETQEMENYIYYGSNRGISEDVYDEIAERIIDAFGI